MTIEDSKLENKKKLKVEDIWYEDPYVKPFSKDILIKPFKNLLKDKTIYLSGSKGITNRILILSVLSKNKIILKNALFSRDTMIMINALINLGFEIDTNKNEKTISVNGLNGKIPNNCCKIFVGNAGTVFRFIPALVSLKNGGEYKFYCDDEAKKRPVFDLLDSLIKCGSISVEYHENEGYLPFTLKTYGFKGGNVLLKVDNASDLIISALCMISPMAENNVKIKVTGKMLECKMAVTTLLLMKEFNIDVEYENDLKNIIIKKNEYKNPNIYFIEPDITALSYFISLTHVIGGDLIINGLDKYIKYKSNTEKFMQHDINFLYMFEKNKLIEIIPKNYFHIKNSYSENIINENFEDYGDTFLTLAAISPLLKSKTIINGVEFTRGHETDRIHSVCIELRKLIGDNNVIENKDGLTVIPNIQELKKKAIIGRKNGKIISINTYHDQRFAMSFAILGCYDLLGDGLPWLQIENPLCCQKTFPEFFDVLENLNSLK
jgi:3-phosphoshikimate 1-carboxyvinyltransferase